MFCFQSSLPRSREASFDRGNEGQRTSDGSIKYIDQVSDASSSTDTLPGARADYLELEPVSPLVLPEQPQRKPSSSVSDLTSLAPPEIREVREAASSPSSPLNLLQRNKAPPLFAFLGVLLRQESTTSTSTSSPQLSTDFPVAARLPQVDGFLKPQSLESSSLSVARSCPNLERQANGSSGYAAPNRPPPFGPKFKPLEEGVIQICYLNHTRTLVSKILSNKFLRRWENHHLYLNDACLTSKTVRSVGLVFRGRAHNTSRDF